MRKIIFSLLIFCFTGCSQVPQQNVGKIPNPQSKQKLQVYFFVEKQSKHCITPFLPAEESFNAAQSSWTLSIVEVENAKEAADLLRDRNARNPDLIIIGPGIALSSLRIAKNGKTKFAAWSGNDALSEVKPAQVSANWSHLQALAEVLCRAAGKDEGCEKMFKTCPSAYSTQALTASPLSIRFSDPAFVNVSVDWLKVFQLLQNSQSGKSVIIDVSSSLIKIKKDELRARQEPALDKALKLWTLDVLGGSK